MKKNILLFVVFAALLSVPMQAQNTLTVADGTEYSTNVPFCGGIAEYYLKDQVIYPEWMLAGMEESNISAITFHLKTQPWRAWTSVFEVKLGITSSTSFSNSYYLSDSLTTLYTGTLSVATDNTLTILLDQPFIYNGGNLLLEIATTSLGPSASAQFYGISTQYGSLYNYNSYSGGAYITTGTRQNFTPKTTFTFTYQDTCRPLRLAVSEIMGSSAFVTWQHGHSVTTYPYEVSYRVVGDASWTVAATTTDESLMLTGLQPQTDYQVRVRSFCGDGTSDAIDAFTTDCSGGHSQPVTIAPETRTNLGGYIPFSTYYAYTYSQQIFTAAEIGGARTFDGIFLQHIGTSATRDIDIYIGHTTKTTFSNGSSWEAVSNLTLVHSGEMSFSTDASDSYWFWIPFDTVFSYNGTDNLVVAFDDNTGSTLPYSDRFYTHYLYGRTLYAYNTSTNIDPASPVSGYTGSYRTNFRLPGECLTADCDCANVVVMNVTNSTAQLQFTSGNGANGVELQYKRSQDDVFVTLPVTGTTYELTGLMHNTEYTVRIRSLCGGSQGSWVEKVFTTTAINYPIVYVSADGTGDGGSWATATGDLNWAVNTAAAIHNTYGTWPNVWVKEGVYYGDTTSESAFTIVEGIWVYGGFAGTETDLSQRNFYLHPSYLDGQNSRRVLNQPTGYSEQSLWDGFTIRNGYSTNGPGGAYLRNNTYLYDCEIINNTGTSGGGVVAYYANLDNCRFRGNVSTGTYSSDGGGALMSSYSTINRCTFTHNRAAKNGGGVYITDANSYYINLSNCLIANNTAANGGGIYSKTSSTIIHNSTIVNNEATVAGAGIYATSVKRVANSIVWGNRTTAGAVSSINGNTIDCFYSAVEGGYSGTGNVMLLPDSLMGGVFSPKFVNPSATVGYTDNTPNPDWHLQNGSVCVNRGNNSYASGNNVTDLDFGQRIQNDTVDMGCYESNFFLHPLPEYGNVIYVTQNGAGTHDGSSWANATDDILMGMSLADMYDADLWVAEGVYYGDTNAYNAFTLLDGVSMYGGFAGTETSLSQRDIAAHVTVLDGGNVRRVLDQPSNFSNRAILDGFTIRNGVTPSSSGNTGAGARLHANITISNCIFTNNQAGYGGGVYADGYCYNCPTTDSLYLLNCTFAYNTATTNSGGAYLRRNVAVRNCTFTHNTSSDACGGLYIDEGIASHCAFTHNTAGGNTGGLSASESVISNCLVANNTSASGGSGISCNRSEIYNCTVVNNASTSTNGSGAGYSNTTVAGAGLSTGTSTSNLSTVKNCIIWGNRHIGSPSNYEGISPCDHSAVEGGASGNGTIVLTSENSGTSPFAPRFVHPSDSVGAFNAPDSSDWRLADGSPCVNRGDNTVATASDLAGNIRILQDTIDLGCYESEYNSTAMPEYGNIIYVTMEGAGTQLGDSWENAIPSLTDAVSIARAYGADVWVAAGTYYGNTSGSNAFLMAEGVNVYGGFAGNEPADYDLSLRDFEANTTILDGQNMRRVLYQPYNFTDSTAVVWDGFTIQNGAWCERGTGVYMLAYATLSNCIVQNNYTYYYSATAYGHVTVYGAGVYVVGSGSSSTGYSTTIENCIIRYNSFENSTYLSGRGAGLWCSNINLSHTVICHNTGNKEGGGMYCTGIKASNCLIHSNQGYQGGGCYSSGNVVFTNCDIVNNRVTGYNCGGGGIYHGGTHVLTNCIVWGNKKGYTVDNISGSGTYTYCAIEGGRTGTGNLNLSASNDGYDDSQYYVRFIDPVNDNFQLHSTSACVNVGNSEAVTDSLDLYGNPRLHNTVDIGCSEVQEFSGCPSVVSLQVSNITTNSAHLSWHSLGTESQWLVVYGIEGVTSNTLTVNDTACTLSGLVLNRNYTAKVRAVCGETMSIFSIPVNFQTVCDPAVLDTLSNFSVMMPADNGIVYQQNVSFSWTNLPEATSYDFYLWEEGGTEPETPTQAGLTFAGVSNFTLPAYERGKHYRWKVVAWNECISKTSPVMTIRVNPLPDLHVNAVTVSTPVAGQPLTVTWTVSNDGEGSTPPGQTWTDFIWLARDLDVREFNYDQDIRLASVTSLQVLNAGESYTNTATVTLPEDIMGNYYLFVISNQHDAYSIDLDPVGGFAPNPYMPSLTGDPYPYLNGLCHSRDMEEVVYYEYHNGFGHFYGMDDFFYVVLNILPPPSPDLVVSSVAHPSNTFSGTTIPLTWTVTNQGEATAMGSWYDAVYLSSDTMLSTVDALHVGTYKHTGNLLVDSSYSRTEQVTIPIEYMGDYRFFVITDNNEEIYEGFFNENNIGMSEHPLTVALTPPADLIVTSIVMPDTVDVNTTYNILFTVKNNGSSPTYGNSWYDNVYISRDSVFNRSTARLLRRIGHSGVLAADASYDKEYPVSIPADLEGGLWYLFVSTDDYSNIFEYTYEDNNVTFIPITVALPDLVVTAIQVSDTVDPNTTVRVTWTVRNDGPGNAIRRTFTDHLRFNGETIYSANVSNLDLAAGDSMVRFANLSLPCSAGAAVLSAITDVDNAVKESDEDNNTLAVPLDIHTPDLTVTGVTLDAETLWSGTPITVTYTVVNSGDMPVSGTVTDHLYFSQQSVGFEEGDLSGTHTYTLALAPGATETVTATVNVPNGISGQYYCHVAGNATGTVCETNPDNNFGHSASVNVQLSPWPDIVVTNVSVEGPVHLGGTFPVQFTIANQGAAPLSYVGANSKFYYSTSATQYDTNHLILTQMDYLNIPSGGEETFTAYMAIPASESPLLYYIHIVADATDLVYEHTDEDNNTAVSNSFVAVVYQLDLMAVEIEGPDEVEWGETVTYRLHVRNNSAVPTLTSQWKDAMYLSGDQALQNDDHLMQQVSHQSILDAGDDYWVNFTTTIPYGTPATAYLLGYVDFYNNNPDINVFNNYVTKAIAVSSVPTPDIAVTEAVLLGEVIAGQPAQLAYTVTNVGDQDISLQSWSDKLFLSTDDSYESGDIELLTQSRRNVTLTQGAAYSDTLMFTVPLPYSGNMYLIVRANASNNPYEANTENNTVVVPVNIILTDPGDLVVTDITSESSVVSGEILHVSWNIQNIGDNALIGNGLRSLLYISTNMEFDANDRLVGNVITPQISLNPGDIVAQSIATRVSGLAEGDYYLIVKTDVANAFYEVDETNNTGCSFEPFTVTIRPLPFNTDVADILYNDSPSDFRMDVDDQIGQTVRIHLASEDSLAGAINMIYVTQNGMGDNLNYTYSTIGQYTANPVLYIPSTSAGYYGVNVYGNTPVGDEQNTVIRADILPFELMAVDANHGGNTGEVTVELTGSHFRPDMDVCLRNGGDTICADTLIYVNYYKAFAQFDLKGRTPGIYDVSAENFCEGESVLADGFEIQEGEPDGLAYNLIFPSSPRPNRNVVMMLEFGNLGNLDLHDQVLEITSNGGCPIALTPEEVMQGNTVLRVPLHIDGQPQGLLRPGCYGTLNIYGYTSGALVFTLKPVNE